MKYIFLKFLLLTLTFCSCVAPQEKSTEPIETLEGNSAQPTEVKVVKALRKEFQYQIHTSGQIEPQNEVDVQFRTTGIVKDLLVTNGQYVRKGQVIARLEDEMHILAYRKAKARFEKATIDYENLLLGFRIEGKPADKQLQIKNTLRFESGLALAEVALEEAQLTMSYTEVRAPISGVVNSMDIKTGNPVNAGHTICRIYSSADLLLRAKILESDISQIKAGLKATIFKLAGQKKGFPAYVSEIDPRVDKYGMVKVRLKLKETEGFMPGMNARAVILVPLEKQIIVPKEALVIRSGREVIFNVENGQAKWNYVSTGLENGNEIEVLDGLKENSLVIVTNNLQLAHDAPVLIKKN